MHILHVIGRSIGQIYFLPNAMSGWLMLGAVLLWSPPAAAFLLLGVLTQNACAYVLRAPAEDVHQGVYGFNGALVGIAAYLLAGFGVRGALCAILGSAVCAGLQYWLVPVLARINLPGMTAPFCLVASVFSLFPASWGMPAESAAVGGVAGIMRGALTSFSQVMLAGAPLTAAIIVAALALGSVRLLIFGAGGAAVGIVGGLAITAGSVSEGLTGYCAVLAAMALGVALPVASNRRTRILTAAGAALLSVVILAVFHSLHWAAFTWPFVLSVWIVVGVHGWLGQATSQRRRL
ncbi:urea transporter [Corynebacterium tapiri]|uniref:Urea transporter n=1 Tax=Corynebacterium tapiri TaxID=1448266 RepID=A0A5C4U3W6_9CORY|nr:urea transporter [Corynebacterium tapiri]TNL96809.1 urea transporter [Corynebacterium tapiri]